MSETWREKSKKRFKKTPGNFFNFADEETTFDAQAKIEETEADPVQDQYKSRLKPEENQPTTRYQVDINSIPTRQQVDTSQVPIAVAEKDEVDTNSIPIQIPGLIPTRYQVDTNSAPKDSIFELTGLQKNLVDLVFAECVKIGNLISPKLTNEFLRTSMKTTMGATKMAISRVVKKGFLIRRPGKYCRGGWVVLELPVVVYQELLKRSVDTNSIPTRHQIDTQLDTNSIPIQIPSTPCSSSILNSDKILTTTEPELWLTVPKNLDGLVSVKQLRDFVKQGLVSVEELQTSLDGFAFDLEKGVVRAKNGNPIAILIGAIKGGGYISQAYLSELKASLAEVEKARVEMHRIRAEHVVEKIKEEFESFRAVFPEEAEKIKPVGSFMNSFQPGSLGYRMWIEEYKRQKENDQNQLPREVTS